MMPAIQAALARAVKRAGQEAGSPDRGALAGRRATTMRTVSTKRRVSRIPGSTPATNRRPMLSSVRIAYTTNPIEGGIRMPSVPPAATAPVARESSYPKRRISGSDTRPMVSAEASDDPDNAENPAQPTIDADARPPRKWPSQAFAAA